MISKEQIAHDLAVSKLSGSSLQSKDLICKYRQYYKEILDCLNAESTTRSAKIINSPM